MRKVCAVVFASMMLAAPSSALAAIVTPNNNGHPALNPAGNCPAGQNRDATPGALNKC